MRGKKNHPLRRYQSSGTLTAVVVEAGSSGTCSRVVHYLDQHCDSFVCRSVVNSVGL